MAGGDCLAALVALHRRLGAERMQLASRDVALPCQHLVLHRLGHLGTEIADADHPLPDPAPDAAALPAAVEYGAGAPGVVITPMVRDGHDLRIGPRLAHVRVV